MQRKRPGDIRKLVLEKLEIPEGKRQFLPRGFQTIGDVVILNLRPEVSGLAGDIARIILDSFSYVRTVCLNSGVSGELRKPSVRYLAGDRDTQTTHRENGCLFRLDVTKVMFSKGNLSERARIPRLVTDGETIVDMFAGIGYFSIPIAKHAKPARLHAMEKNPLSFRYLKENLRLNRVQGIVTPMLGDCRESGLEGMADRILMGYLPGTSRYLPAAFGMLKPSGGTIHYHDNFHESELWGKPPEVLESEAQKAGYALDKVSHKAVVKEHSPRVYHVVIDAEFSSNQ